MQTTGAKTLSESNPKAIIVITAHWQTEQPTISHVSKYDMYYDYYGFPAEMYEIKYPVAGDYQVIFLEISDLFLDFRASHCIIPTHPPDLYNISLTYNCDF